MSRRHPHVDRLCLNLHRIVVGRAAADLSETAGPGPAAVVVLPTWGWAVSGISVGRKDIDPAGGRYLLPVRYTFDSGPVLLLQPGAPARKVEYTGTGMGHQVTGAIRVSAAAPGTTASLPTDDELALPQVWQGPAVDDPGALLADLAEQGKAAYWDTLNHLERLSHSAIARAVASLQHEVADTVPGQLLDRVAVDTVKDRLVYGDPDTDTASSMCRLIERCVNPATFVGTDPGHYVSIQVSRDAKQAVRRAIGDPWIGSKIRRVAAEVGGPTDPNVLLRIYRERYPADGANLHHIVTALTLRPSPHAGTAPLSLVELDASIGEVA